MEPSAVAWRCREKASLMLPGGHDSHHRVSTLKHTLMQPAEIICVTVAVAGLSSLFHPLADRTINGSGVEKTTLHDSKLD